MLKVMCESELKEIIEKHEMWLSDKNICCQADLSNADLFNADLFNANLSNANLSRADLFNADLSGADLSNANLFGAHGNMKEIKSIQIEFYTITYTDSIIQIGCKNHTIEDWFNFNDKQILKMNGKKALIFWRKWKPILKQFIGDDNEK